MLGQEQNPEESCGEKLHNSLLGFIS